MSNVTPISRAAALSIASAELAEVLNPDTFRDVSAARKEAESRADQMANRIQGIGVLDVQPEWVVTGREDLPTLWHLLNACYSDTTKADEWSLRSAIADIRMSYLIPGGKKIALECFRCGLARSLCTCCERRLALDHTCLCFISNDPADREVWDVR